MLIDFETSPDNSNAQVNIFSQGHFTLHIGVYLKNLEACILVWVGDWNLTIQSACPQHCLIDVLRIIGCRDDDCLPVFVTQPT